MSDGWRRVRAGLYRHVGGGKVVRTGPRWLLDFRGNRVTLPTLRGAKSRHVHLATLEQIERVTEVLVDHVTQFYGGDDPLKWPTDRLRDLARTLRGSGRPQVPERLEACSVCDHRAHEHCAHPDVHGAGALPPAAWRRRDLVLVASFCPLPPPRWAEDSRDHRDGTVRDELERLEAAHAAVGAAPVTALETHRSAVAMWQRTYDVADAALNLLRRVTG